MSITRPCDTIAIGPLIPDGMIVARARHYASLAGSWGAVAIAYAHIGNEDEAADSIRRAYAHGMVAIRYGWNPDWELVIR